MTITSGTTQRYGLTEGLSSRILRASRPSPLPSLMLLHHERLSERTDKLHLHGRLEELLVFEILQTGDATYKRFNVRKLYKYVINAIRTESKRGGMDMAAPSFSDGNIRPNQDTSQPLKTQDDPKMQERSSVFSPNAVDRTKWLGGFLHPRDMRKLTTPFSASNEPELIVRRHVMLLNFDPLRVIILRDRAIVLVPSGADSLLVELENRIHGKGPHSPFTVSDYQSSVHNSSLSTSDHPVTNKSAEDHRHEDDGDAEDDTWKLSWIDQEWADLDAKEWMDLPFELQCVDAILSIVTTTMAEDILDLQLGANTVISALVTKTTYDGDLSEETLRTIKNTVREMISRVQGFNRALKTILEDNEDLALMNLSRLLTHPQRFVQPVPPMVLEEESDEPELLLEAHVQQGYTLINALVQVEGQVTSTEAYANRKSDAIRNELLYINAVVSILMLSMGFGSLVGSFFGMNVPHPYGEAPNAFLFIVFTTLAAMILICAVLLLVLWKPGALRCAGQKL